VRSRRGADASAAFSFLGRRNAPCHLFTGDWLFGGEHEITPEEVKELLSEGRSALIEDFVSKRGNKFGAHLVLSQKKDKAEFEFPPR